MFEKLEMRAPDLPVVHAFLGAVFERRGDARDAFDEYRRALRLGPRVRLAPSLPRLSAPPPRPGRIAARSASAGTRCARRPAADRLDARVGARRPRPRLPGAVPRLRARTLAEGRRDPLCGACWAADPAHRAALVRALRSAVRALALTPVPAEAVPRGRHLRGCRVEPPAWDWARAAAEYEGVVRDAIHAFKFEGQRALAVRWPRWCSSSGALPASASAQRWCRCRWAGPASESAGSTRPSCWPSGWGPDWAWRCGPAG